MDLKSLLEKPPKDDLPCLGNTYSYQFAVLGENGAGKSTTLYWLAWHAQLAENVRELFTRSIRGSSSHTQMLISVPFSKAVSMWDTRGLPDFDVKHVSTVRRLLDGCMRLSLPMTWESEDSWAAIILSSIISYFTSFFPSLYVLSPSPSEPKPYYDTCACEKPDPAAMPHAILFLLKHSENEKHKADLENFISHARKQIPLFEPVVAVTHLPEACNNLASTTTGTTPSSCAERFAQGIGLREHDSIFALIPEKQAQGRKKSGSENGRDVYLSPGQLAPIIKRLRHKAFKNLMLHESACFKT